MHTDLQKLPILKTDELIKCSSKQRPSKDTQGFYKMVSAGPKYFLVFRSLEEIRNMDLPLGFTRPLVLMQDTYEAIEYCLFFYERKLLPLIGEVLNPAVLFATAKQYEVDSIYFDSFCAGNFYPELKKLKLPLKSITLIDSKIDTKYLKLFKGMKVNYIISLPEFGPVAYACKDNLKKGFVFHAFDDVMIEEGKNALLTSLRLNFCPMIRYKSNLNIEEININCSCSKKIYSIS